MTEQHMNIRRPTETNDMGRGPGSGPTARYDGSKRTAIKVSKSFSIPENIAKALKVASALSGREQSEILVDAITPVIRQILQDNRESLDI